MGALAGLVEKGLVAPDWAEALAPVDEQIGLMGQFLREEIAAGRGYLPAGDHVLRAFSRPLSEVKVLIVGQDPYPTPGHPGRAQLLGRARGWRRRRAWSTSSPSWSTISAYPVPPAATSPRGPTPG